MSCLEGNSCMRLLNIYFCLPCLYGHSFSKAIKWNGSRSEFLVLTNICEYVVSCTEIKWKEFVLIRDVKDIGQLKNICILKGQLLYVWLMMFWCLSVTKTYLFHTCFLSFGVYSLIFWWKWKQYVSICVVLCTQLHNIKFNFIYFVKVKHKFPCTILNCEHNSAFH